MTRASTIRDQDSPLTQTAAWDLLLALRARVAAAPLSVRTGLRLDAEGTLREVPIDQGVIVVDPAAPRGWSWPTSSPGDPTLSSLFDLYVPLLVGPSASELTVAHLAQSLDGRIATANGVSQFISGDEDLLHNHRMRALFDAVVVGASTVEHDDPQLTTRHCPGEDPARVVIDPLGRIGPEARMVRDGPAPTVLVNRAGVARDPLPAHVTVVEVESDDQWLPVSTIVAALRRRGLLRIFIEGGGVTVSRFLDAGVLDRLQVCVSPTIIGSGRPSFTLPEVLDLDGARALRARPFVMGRDILFDCTLDP